MKSFNKKKLSEMISLFATPTFLLILGAVLLMRPDTASALLGTVLGWVLTAIGAVLAIHAGTAAYDKLGKAIPAAACLCIGIWMLKSPLSLVSALGRIVGIVLLVRGIRDLRTANALGYGKGLAIATIAAGAVLLLLPMTTSRLVFSLCGLVVMALGVAVLLERLGLHKRLRQPDESNIIDAL